jgi:hypothetical protein
MIYINSEVLFSHKEEWNDVIFRKLDRNENHDVKWNKPDAERQVLHLLSYMESRFFFLKMT